MRNAANVTNFFLGLNCMSMQKYFGKTERKGSAMSEIFEVKRVSRATTVIVILFGILGVCLVIGGMVLIMKGNGARMFLEGLVTCVFVTLCLTRGETIAKLEGGLFTMKRNNEILTRRISSLEADIRGMEEGRSEIDPIGGGDEDIEIEIGGN
jgi:hypothetical protein